jgi:hypothetical protein
MEALLNEKRVAETLGMSLAALRRWRYDGRGPGYLQTRLGCSVPTGSPTRVGGVLRCWRPKQFWWQHRETRFVEENGYGRRYGETRHE